MSADVFAALADARRRELVTLLGDRDSATATELAGELPVSRQAVQKHLTGLEAAGLVARTRVGREVRYRLTPEPMSDAVSWIAEVGARWDERLAALAEQVRPARPR